MPAGIPNTQPVPDYPNGLTPQELRDDINKLFRMMAPLHLRVMSGAPVIGLDIEEGQVIFRNSGTGIGYTVVNGTLRSWNLT